MVNKGVYTMTRKHFKIIAGIISTIQNDKIRKETAINACFILRNTNPNFDSNKFLRACNVM